MDATSGGLVTAIFIAIVIAIFIAIREFWAWYLKTNKLIENQNKIIGELKKQSRIFEDISDKLTDLIPKKIEEKEEEENFEEIKDRVSQKKEPIVPEPKENDKVKCSECKWEGEFKDLKVKEDNMGKFEVCPKCGSGRWDNI